MNNINRPLPSPKNPSVSAGPTPTVSKTSANVFGSRAATTSSPPKTIPARWNTCSSVTGFHPYNTPEVTMSREQAMLLSDDPSIWKTVYRY
jgi:hypothetical protein